MSFPDVWLYSLQREATTRAIGDGIKAAVRAYYENFTDATELEAVLMNTLDGLIELTGVDLDLYLLIYHAEQAINESGGIVSDTDGTRHQVRTAHVWEMVGDD